MDIEIALMAAFCCAKDNGRVIPSTQEAEGVKGIKLHILEQSNSPMGLCIAIYMG